MSNRSYAGRWRRDETYDEWKKEHRKEIEEGPGSTGVLLVVEEVVEWCGRRGCGSGRESAFCLLAPLEQQKRTSGAIFVATLSLSMSPVDRPRHSCRAVVIGGVGTKSCSQYDIFPSPCSVESQKICVPTRYLYHKVCVCRSLLLIQFWDVSHRKHAILPSVQAARSLQPSTGLKLDQS